MSASVLGSGSSLVPINQVRKAQITQPSKAAIVPTIRAVRRSMYRILPMPAATLDSNTTATAWPIALGSCSSSS
ncbi:MAG: hypothetical protein U5K99_06190 [Anaerolineales bacterium]|nr:hypothetical protein [Anaerolineales bacterium]